MGERRGTRGLELWCKRMTEGYPGVKVENMTTSWRDGLAFCAIIHHFRPDLIDFTKLNKNDIYNNNNLAFRIAEDHLGIPALLEPEDMVEYAVPDRLSILTYLSQFYQVFAVNSSSSTKIPAKRPPPADFQKHMVTAPSSTPPKKAAYGALSVRREPCAKCGLPVFIAERLNVGKALYHRTCFRCAKCDTQLTPDNYNEPESGVLRCKTCPDKMAEPISQAGIMTRSLSDEEKSASLKEKSDPYSANFENALEDTQDSSLKRNFTLERMLGNAFQKARTDFMTTQMVSFDSDQETDSEEKPPDLPVSPKPELPKEEEEHSENIDVLSINNSLPCLSDNSSVDSDRLAPNKEQCESLDSITKDSIQAVAIKPSIRSRMKFFEVGIESRDKADANKETLKKEHEIVFRVGPSKETYENKEESPDEVFDSNLSIHVSQRSSPVNPINNDAESSHVHSSILSISSILSDPNDVIVLSSDNLNSILEENSVIIVSDDSNAPNPHCENTFSSEGVTESKPTKEYPTDLNPFGDDEETVEQNVSATIESVAESSKSVSLNPFGDTDDEDEKEGHVENSKSLNPFDSDEEAEVVSKPHPMLRKLKAPKISLTPYWESESSLNDTQSQQKEKVKNKEEQVSPKPRLRRLKAPTINLPQICDDEPSAFQTGVSTPPQSGSEKSSLHGSGRKKKPAPKPPIPQEFIDSPYSSLRSNASQKVTKETPRSRKNRRAPLPPSSTPNITQSSQSRFDEVSPILETTKQSQSKIGSEGNMKAAKDEMNRNMQQGSGPSCPPKKLTMKEIEHQLELVEVQMRGLEKNGVILEKLIREKSEVPGANPDDTLSPEVDDMIIELFELVNEKCELFRKQTELNYLRRQNRLEREQAEIENQLRCLMLQPDAHKTDCDKAKEEELLNKMLEIVERRNEIVDRLEYDRRRETEEDISIRNHMCLYSKKRESEHSSSKKSAKKDKQKREKEKKNKKSKGDNDQDVDTSKTTSKDKKKKKVLNLF